MVRVLDGDKTIIVYSEHFLYFELKIEEPDIRKPSIKSSKELNIVGENASYLIFQCNSGLTLSLQNAKSLLKGSCIITIYDKNNSSIYSHMESTVDFSEFERFYFFIRLNLIANAYPITISGVVRSSNSILTRELNRKENSTNELSADLINILEEPLNTDVVLSTDEGDIKAHKIILQARSPVLKKMFQHDLSETIQIKDIGHATMMRLVKYLYSGSMKKCSFDETVELYYAADKYEVLSLRNSCRKELFNKLDINNACPLFTLANRHNDDCLKDGVVQFVNANFISVIDSEQYCDMSKEDMMMLTRLAAKPGKN